MTTQVGPMSFPSKNAFRTGMVIGGGVSLLAALITLAIPYEKPAVTSAGSASPAPEAVTRDSATRS